MVTLFVLAEVEVETLVVVEVIEVLLGFMASFLICRMTAVALYACYCFGRKGVEG